ncbi:MAG: hypothetical protein GC168_16835 [Candidatus Hydrogenedens sp.]|nr:hypothetical protein [Candidatus Hydrogenedens sp.]
MPLPRAVSRLLKWVVAPVALLGLALGGFVVLFVGPWPSYREPAYDNTATLARIGAAAAENKGDAPQRLQAGWAERDITPPIGTPLGGYSDRPNEKRCIGIHDPVYVRAIVLSDGANTVALIGADLLMTTLNIARIVWERVGEKTGLGPNDILFTTTHTHCAPGGFAPGLLADYSLGTYDPAIEELIANALSEAIIEAHANLEPAGIAHGEVDAGEWIYNRTNVEGKDPSLKYAVLKQDDGDTCYAVRYSAHPNTLPEEFLEVSAEYPGVLCDAIKAKTGGMAVLIGGAYGAMGPVTPKEGTPVERMTAMGQGLAERFLTVDFDALEFDTTARVRSLGVTVDMAPMQGRPWEEAPDWRFSPLFAHVVGLPPEGWIQGVRVGDIVWLGLPYDSGGAIAPEWASAAAAQGTDLWISSHCIAYCGYLSPDEYYWQDTHGYDQYYEWRLMNWFGPGQEAQYAELKDKVIAALAE